MTTTYASLESVIASGIAGYTANPANFGSLLAWVEPGDSGQSLSGSLVNSVPNAGSIGGTYSESGSARPTYEATGWGGTRPSYLFDGVANMLRNDAVSAAFGGQDTLFTAIMSVQILTLGNGKYFWSFGSSSSNNPLVALRTVTSGPNTVLSPYVGEDGGAASAPAGSTALTTGRSLITLYTGPAGQTINSRINQVQDHNNAAWDRGVHTMDRHGLGGLVRAVESAFINMRMGGFLLYAGVLDSTSMQFAERYLLERWPL